MGIFGAILGFDGTQASSSKVGSRVEVTVYHDGVDYEFEGTPGNVKCVHQTEGNTVSEAAANAAETESWNHE